MEIGWRTLPSAWLAGLPPDLAARNGLAARAARPPPKAGNRRPQMAKAKKAEKAEKGKKAAPKPKAKGKKCC